MTFRTRLRKLTLATCVAALAALPATADTAGDLSVSKLKVRHGKQGATVNLAMSLPADSSLQTIDMTTAPFRVLLGDATVFELPPAGQRPQLTNTGFVSWRYKDGRRGPKLILDLDHGRVKLKAKKLDLGDSVAAGSAGVSIRVEIEDRTFETVVDVKRKRRVLKLVKPVVPVLPPGQDPGIDIGFTVRELETGWFSGIDRREFAVARTPEEWSALWSRHGSHQAPAPALPDVDFAQEMVIGVFLGNRADPSHSVEIRRVRSGEAGLLVEYDDVRIVDRNCAFPAVLTQPYVLVRLPRYDTVHFQSRIVQRDCPTE